MVDLSDRLGAPRPGRLASAWASLGREFHRRRRRAAQTSLTRGAARLRLSSASDFSATRMTTDKEGRPLLLAADRRGDSLMVRAFRRYRSGHEAVLFASVEGSQATIRDIGCFASRALNRGIGTALLRFAEDVLREHGVTRVRGWLSPADIDHRDRQVHFYLKNDYEVSLDNAHGGTITKSLVASPWVRDNNHRP